MPLDEAFAPLRSAFPSKATFHGTHFTYAAAGGSVLIERKRTDQNDRCRCPTCGQPTGERETRYHLWLLIGGTFELVHVSRVSALDRLRTIGDSFSPRLHAAH